MKYTENPLTKSHRGFRLKSVPSIASPSVESTEHRYPGYGSSSADVLDGDKIKTSSVDGEAKSTSEAGSYEAQFTTVFNLRRRVLKGYRVNNACLDCRIHLSALRCYEEHGLEYIDKRKEDFTFDTSPTSGYGDAVKIGAMDDANGYAPRHL